MDGPTPTSDHIKKDKLKKAALRYHEKGRPGKVEVVATKACDTQRDLSLAYSPGVAYPCLSIAKNPDNAYRYTAKENLVAVLSNGSAVLGLGNIGPLAGKPVMEGKGVLFKKFADVDVFDIEVNESSVEGMVSVIKALGPTFGGINLEDIKAPECFEIERICKETMDIPVFHDDQHGTAIIASAAFINALEISDKKIDQIKAVFSGAGAASIACAKLFIQLGVRHENLIMCDSKGVIYKGRKEGMNKYKEEFANETKHRSLAQALDGADAFIGCSARGVLSKDMVRSMSKDPIIFAMANPDPEILPEEVAEIRNDAIMATGRSDYPNQVNNVLGFPFIFRGALDVRAKKINEEMKLAAVHALSMLAKEEVPDEVKGAYGNENFSFGRNYLIPKPFDKRVLTRVAPAVAKAAMESNVARSEIPDFKTYVESLENRLGVGLSFIRSLRDRINGEKKPKIVFPEGTNARILRAVSIIVDEGKITPIFIGNKEKIHLKMEKMGIDHLKNIDIVDPYSDSRYEEFSKKYYALRQRKGINYQHARAQLKEGNYFGAMLVKEGHADGMITGAAENYPECLKPVLSVSGVQNNKNLAGVIVLVFKHRILFLADCTMQISPSAQELAEVAMATTKLYRQLMLKEPKLAFLSFSNFGSNASTSPKKVASAVNLLKDMAPELMADGEMQADVAVSESIREKLFNFSSLKGDPDILIFPSLNSANISYKLLVQLADATPVGPVLIPLNTPINIVQRTSTVSEIVNMSTLTALMAQEQSCHA